MEIMLHIFTNNILPIFLLVGLGFILAKKFSMDIGTLTKINFYVLVPSFTFVYLYSTPIPLDMLKVLVAALILMILNYTSASVISHFRHFDKKMKNAFINSIIFYNSGNIGIPLITLIFSNKPYIVDGETPYLNLALTSQIMVLVVQNILTNTLGFYNAGSASMKWQESVRKILHMPAIYVISMALILKLFPFDMTKLPVWPALVHLRNALVPTALLILGIQIARTKFYSIKPEVILSVLFRLIGGPLFALFIIYALSLKGVIAQAFLVSASVPTAVNTALIAVEYDNCPEFASQVVLISTIACTITLSLIIYMSRILFPVV
ncbi:MAG TPA: AEC family transporter [Clostridiaceae bacterium]|nr:AEC family transporter [Clostridiaceae bacterium]